MDKIEDLLSKHHAEDYQFSEGFTDGVMASIAHQQDRGNRQVRLWERGVWTAMAACFVAVLISVYALDGSLSFDSILGLSEHSSSEVSQSIETYDQWDIE